MHTRWRPRRSVRWRPITARAHASYCTVQCTIAVPQMPPRLGLYGKQMSAIAVLPYNFQAARAASGVRRPAVYGYAPYKPPLARFALYFASFYFNLRPSTSEAPYRPPLTSFPPTPPPPPTMSAFAAPAATPRTTLFTRPSVSPLRLHLPTAAPPSRAVIHATSDPLPSTAADYDALSTEWTTSPVPKTPVQIIDHALSTFPNQVAIAFSGAEDVVLVEYASRTKRPFRVFALDTGRLHPETYRFYAEVEKHYGIRIEYTFPESAEVTELVNEKGLFSFYEDGHQECCRVRKVRPLRRKLGTLKAWITGQRRDQSPGTRAEIPVVQMDPAFQGVHDEPLIKYNPLANETSSQVWATIRATEVPYNALHLAGFISIGCEPCTRPVLPNQHEREGRWWWEEATQKECGLHKGNISEDAAAAELADEFVTDRVAVDKVVVFTKRGCPYCAQLKELFGSLQVPYAEHEISEMDNYGDLVAALERATGQTTAPNLFIGGKHIGGNDDTQKLHLEGKLVPLFEAAGLQVSVPA